MCACLAMAVYIAFDLLDLDGSELRDPLPSNAIAAESAPAETERVFPQRLSTPDALGSFSHSLAFRSAPEVSRPSPSLRIAAFTARLAHLRPRAYMSREAISTITPPDDPA
jgi:hypothetical protein